MDTPKPQESATHPTRTLTSAELQASIERAANAVRLAKTQVERARKAQARYRASSTMVEEMGLAVSRAQAVPPDALVPPDPLPYHEDGYAVTDPNGIILEANAALVRLLGVPEFHLVGKPLSNYVSLGERPALRRALNTLHDTRVPLRIPETLFVQLVPRTAEKIEAVLHFADIREAQNQHLICVRWVVRPLRERTVAESERYRLLVNVVQDYAVFLLGSDGLIISWNPGAQAIFGHTEADILNQPYANLFSTEERQVREPQEQLRLARTRGRVREEGWLVQSDGTLFCGQIVLNSLPGNREGSRGGFAAIVRDTAQGREETDDLRLALDAARAATWDWNLDTGIVQWSEKYWSLSGLPSSPQEPTYDLWLRTIHPDDRKRAEQVVQEAIRTGHPFANMYRIASPHGAKDVWLLSRGDPLRDKTGRVYRLIGVTVDITEYKTVEMRLETHVAERTVALEQVNTRLQAEILRHRRTQQDRDRLTQQLESVQDEESRRISRELHDQMGQHLTAFSLGLRSLENALPAGDAPHTLLRRLRGIAEEMGRDVHRIAVELRPPALDDLGLCEALAGYVEEWAARTGIDAEFHTSGFSPHERVKGLTAITLYRIVQEALNNVARHSGATQASVVLQKRGELVLIVEDNGKGFTLSVDDAASRTKLGLVGIQERGTLIGGTVTIESNNNNGGTTLFVHVPLPPEDRFYDASERHK